MLIEFLNRAAREAAGQFGEDDSLFDFDSPGDSSAGRHTIIPDAGERAPHGYAGMLGGTNTAPGTAEAERQDLAELGVSVGTF